MAARTVLPPQAYTKETLTAAFNWLQSQPESIRKLATSPDILVSLFMRAQKRDQRGSLESKFTEQPKESEDSLPLGSVRSPWLAGWSESTSQVASESADSASRHFEGTSEKPQSQGSTALLDREETHWVQPSSSTNINPRRPSETFELNLRSRELVKKMKERLNLSTESEALNLMVSVAHRQLKKWTS